MRADLRKRKPSRLRKRRIVRSMECPDEDEDEAMIGGPDPNKLPAQIQGKKLDE
jgi:hypothetical protein